MKIADALDMAEGYIRAQPSTNAMMVAFRGLDTVAIVELTAAGRGDLVYVAHLMAGGYGADVLAFVTDTYTTTHRVNPLTGREWEANDMDTLAREHDGIAKGWVSDAMMAHVINRAGDQAVTSMPYRIVDGEHVWGEVSRLLPDDEGRTVGGALSEGFADAMGAPQLAVVLERMRGSSTSEAVLAAGGDPETTRAVLDCGVTRHLMEADCVQAVAMPVKGDGPRTDVVREFMDHLARQS